MNVERYVHDHEWGVEFVVTNSLTFTFTATEARALADALNAAVSNPPDLCICRHRYASFGDLCGVCSTAHEPRPAA